MALKPGQEKCINTLDRSLVVAAGAGSGKTFTLTKRIVHAIQSGAVDGIDRVCAITFTNKAAGELKSRIKAELRACGLHDQALKVDESWVSTIHGMCARILRSHAVELDIDPMFVMADTTQAQALMDAAIDEVLTNAQAGVLEVQDMQLCADDVDALFAEYPARSFGMRGDSVESMLQTLMNAAGSSERGFDAFVVPENRVNAASLAYALLDAFESLAALAQAERKNEAREAWAASTEQLVAEIRDNLQKGIADDALSVLKELDRLEVPKKVGSATYKAHVEETLVIRQECVMELRLAAAARHLKTLVCLARCASDSFAARKRRAGILDNNDLLVLAYRAVSDYPHIAACYEDKFQLVMVDEFQDTDQMQVDMIKRLAGPDACRLCTVGDAQQSIYRFRGADVSVYRRHLEHVKSGNADDVILLPDNFRSHADVLSLVDRVFERPQMFGGSFMSLAPGRDELRVKRPFASDVARVQVQLTSNSYRGAKQERVREVAAERIACAFSELHERGHSAGEMAVLLGGMTYADVYADALRAKGLACVISGGSVFSHTPEAALVQDIVTVVANPYNTQALHNVLVGPLFELSAGDLLVIATMADTKTGKPRRRNLYEGLKACERQGSEASFVQSWSAQLALAVRVMNQLFRASGRSSVARVVMRAVVDSGLVSRLQAQGAEGLASAANVYKAIRMVDTLESAEAMGPARVARLFGLTLSQSKEAPGALSASGGDFVRIMTVHASKGLEFPIVAVAEFREKRASTSKLLSSQVDGDVYLSLDAGNSIAAFSGAAKLGGLGSLYAEMMQGRSDEDELAQAITQADGALALRSALSEHERIGDEEESKRLLYVALTRAKEALVISLMGTRSKDNPLATPKSSLGAVVPALAGEGEGFDSGVSLLAYGGSAPALVEHVMLDEDGRRSDQPQAGGSDEGAAAPNDEDPANEMCDEDFLVPEELGRIRLYRGPYAPAHDGVFSYSSIADASHEGDVLERLASVAFASADEAESAGMQVLALQPNTDVESEFDFAFSWQEANRNAALADEDEGSWSYGGASCDDADKATDFGTAFHRLAQYAVVTRASGPLQKPDDDRVRKLACSCGLDGEGVARLNGALDRWFESDLSQLVAQYERISAEVPFFVNVPTASQTESCLEGEIDLLALDQSGLRALVVDYKTGGRDDETEQELRIKHVLQASCYAYAIMLQGVRTVDAHFVRVERARAGAPNQPQCVRYRFTSDDLPLLSCSIAEVYARRQA